MTAQLATTLKGYFNIGDIPSESNFADLIDTILSPKEMVSAIGSSSTAQTLRKIVWSGADVNSRDWNENLSTWINTGGGNNNNTWQMGYNNAATGGGVDATEPSWYIQMESNYNPTATAHVPVFEYHLNAYTAGGGTPVRPFQYNAARDGTWIEAFYKSDKTNWMDRSGTQIMILDHATGNLDLTTKGIRVLQNNVQAIGQYNAARTAIRNLIFLSGADYVRVGDTNTPLVQLDAPETWVSGNFSHHGTTLGFYNATKVTKPTGVAVTAAGIHAALVSLGLIAA